MFQAPGSPGAPPEGSMTPGSPYSALSPGSPYNLSNCLGATIDLNLLDPLELGDATLDPDDTAGAALLMVRELAVMLCAVVRRWCFDRL